MISRFFSSLEMKDICELKEVISNTYTYNAVSYKCIHIRGFRKRMVGY